MHHKDIQLKCLKTSHTGVYCVEHSVEHSVIVKHLISGEICLKLMRVSKPKANTLNICCDMCP